VWLDVGLGDCTIGRMRLREEANRVTAGGRELRASRRRVSLAALLVCALGLPSLAAEPAKEGAAERKDPGILAEFNIEKGERYILVPVRVQEREYSFVLDTGASLCVFDASLRKLLGKPIQVREADTAAEPITVEVFNPPEAYVGELDLREGGPVVCSDLEGLRRVLGREIRGILGMGFLKKYVVRIDFDSGKVQFRPWDGRPHSEWGRPVHLDDGGEENKNLHYVRGSLPGAGDIRFFVDSGLSGAGDLDAEVFERTKDKKAVAEGLAETAAGTRRSRKTRISSLALGGFDHRGLVMAEGNDNRIGLGLLSRYVVTLDFLAMKMYLQKGQAFDKPDEVDMSGLHLWRLKGQTAVHSVDKDSPAEAAGIKAEDVVLKVGEKNAKGIDIEDLRDLLQSGDGKEIKMTIKRGGEEKAVSFRLKRRI